MAEHELNGRGRVNYYSVSGFKKRLYQSSKEEKEGYEPVETANGVYYHRYVSGLSGKITGVKALADDKFEGISVYLTDDDTGETYNFKVKLSSSSARAFIHSFYNVDFDEKVLVSFFPKENPNKDNSYYQGVVVEYVEKDKVEVKPDLLMHPRPEWYKMEDIPKPVKGRGGKWDYKEQEDYLYKKMEEIEKRFNESEVSQPKEDPIDELPF